MHFNKKAPENHSPGAVVVLTSDRPTDLHRCHTATLHSPDLVIAQLVDRIEIRKNDGYDITIHWRMTAEQFLGRKKEESA